MLLKKIYVVNFIDENQQHQKLIFSTIEKAEEKWLELNEKKIECWITTETFSLA